MSKIVVVGSSNTDMVIRSEHLPAPGETVLGGHFLMNPGGKGANQAVAASKLGGDVSFIARVGDDLFGQQAIRGFEKYGIRIENVRLDEHNPSGVALIMVDDAGENSISVALGANAALQQSDVDKAEAVISQASYLLVQLEIPLLVVEYAITLANAMNVPVILNPAPAQRLSDKLLAGLHIITPNETEAEILTGQLVKDEESARLSASVLHSKGVDIVIITLGDKGAYVLSNQYDALIPSPSVASVDTTAAGDTFNGALVVALSESMGLPEAITFANHAAALSVTKEGAQASIPSRSALEAFLT